MGFRINTAIGWGMPFEEFQRLCLVPGIADVAGDDWSALLEAAMEGTQSMKPKGWPLPTTGPNDTCFDLIGTIGYDDASDVILYPSMDEMRKWHRRDDDIDYALIWGPRPPDDHDTPENVVEYLRVGLHPYGNLRMNPDGTEAKRPREDDEAWEWERDPTLLPGLPQSLRHWTLASGLLGLEGLAALRPMRARWWA